MCADVLCCLLAGKLALAFVEETRRALQALFSSFFFLVLPGVPPLFFFLGILFFLFWCAASRKLRGIDACTRKPQFS
jgi:hypothetical protein